MATTVVKVVIVGDAIVGKSCFITTFVNNAFPDKYIPSVFDDYSADMMVDGKPVSLSLWDASGLEDYDRLRPLSYPQTDIFLVAFAVDCTASFEMVREHWIHEIKHYCPNTPWLLLGLKADLRNSSAAANTVRPGRVFVTQEAARDMARELGAVGYYECSALTQSGLTEAMSYAVRASLYPSGNSSNRKRFTWFRRKRTTEVPVNIMVSPLINISTSTFTGDWKRMVNCEDLADVAFLLGPKTYHAHKYVLCSASDVFRRMFGVEDTAVAASIGECPHWNKKRLEEVTAENICGGKVAGLRDIKYSGSTECGKLVTTITLDETLISEVPFLRCLEFLYTGIVDLEAKSTLIDETIKVAELFNLPELQTICDNAKKGEYCHNPGIQIMLQDRKCGIAKHLFLNQPQLSDVRVMVEGKVIHAHKVVFMARCDVLSAMFRNGFVESEVAKVELHDITYENMLAFLEYLYTDSCPLNDGNAVGILILSNKYLMPRLKSLCEHYLAEAVEKAQVTDVIALLLTAQLHNAPQLSAACLVYISNNYTSFSTKPEFCLLTGDNLSYVLSQQGSLTSYEEALRVKCT